MMNSSANWIWTPEDDGGRNITVCFRHRFSLKNVPREARLEISADSRYVLYVNGERVGQGPARSWNHLKQYDRYEISRYLRKGDNAIAVQVVRWGITHGQYAGGPGGLSAQLTSAEDNSWAIVTDGDWKTTLHRGYTRRVPRMTWGQAFSEQYDARHEFGDWMAPHFDDSDWQNAEVSGPVGTHPWVEMRPRPIPFLTEQPVYPVRVFDIRAVQPPANSYGLDLYDALHVPGEPTNVLKPCGIIVADLQSDQPAEVTMVRMNRTCDLDLFGDMRINGIDVPFPSDRATFSVQAGSNLLVVRYNRNPQALPSWVFESEANISLRSPVGDPDGPVALYISEAEEDPVLEKLWAAHSVDEVSKSQDVLRPVLHEERYIDVFALSNMRRELPDVPAVVQSAYALCSANSEYAVAVPPENGDLEFLLDFREEIVGLIEFEIDAPEGAIVDFNCFEAIIDGVWSWTDNLNNTIRYTTRDGWQRFHSTIRRGFRYAQVTIRNASRPVRIREIMCLQNTYPVQNEGAFACSDALLNTIWDLGRRTTRLCMEDTFVDCPAYEQTYWVGDSRNEALAAYTAFGDTALTEHCLRLAAESMWRSPLVECAVPSGYGGIIPNWSMFWIIACEEHYGYTGNLPFAQEIFPSILQSCRYMLSRRDERGLWQLTAWNMLDWAAMDCPPDGIIAHENILMVETLRRAASLADIVGSAEGENLRTEAENLRRTINEHLWDEEKHAYVDSIHADGSPSEVLSQQTQTMAYLCDCVPPERLPFVEHYITDVPDGWVKIGSPWMMWFSLEAMAKKGSFDTIPDWIREHWGQMLEYDATTCWEMFAGWGTGRWIPTRSWCHAWSAAPTYFLSTYQLGVQMLETGWRRALIAPRPCGLTWAKGRVPTPKGTIAVSWKIIDNKINLSVILPPEIEAEVSIPDGYEAGQVQVRHSTTTTSP